MHLQQLKGKQSSKRVPFVNEEYKRGTFSIKNIIWKGKGLDLGTEHPPLKTLLSTYHPPPRAFESLLCHNSVARLTLSDLIALPN